MPRSLRIVALVVAATLATAVPTLAAGPERAPDRGAHPSLTILESIHLDQLLERVLGVIAKIGPEGMPGGEATSGEDEEGSFSTDSSEGGVPLQPPSS